VNQEQRMAQHNLGEEEDSKELFEQAAAKIHIHKESEGDLRTTLRGRNRPCNGFKITSLPLGTQKKKAFDEPVASRKHTWWRLAASGRTQNGRCRRSRILARR
jgi:hypothetical protein